MNKQKIMNVWDKVAPTFGKIGPGYWQRFGNRLVELSSINKGKKILDIGVGRGASLFSAINKIGKEGYAVGIDASEVMVSETHKDIEKQKIDNAKVIKMNAQILEFDDNFFDNVICGFGIGYLLYSDSKLTEILRVLKKDGQVGFSIWAIQEDQKWLTEIVNKYLHANSSNQNYKSGIPKFDTAKDVRKILENTGLRNIKVYKENADVIYTTKEQWWEEMWSNAVRAVFEAVEEIGDDKFKEFKVEVFNGLEMYKNIDGLHFNMPVIYAFGEK
ncbi:class I SAM-dependent methyltransferase [Clostridium tagluense]|uniref:class I SAM-dependent methyltransferase n=1 Tax=Clostridium tagluense TaxID=360422 RepID=UPI001C6DF98D|nr:class I SAM-dependent methyltransferase [Clostridium tagluense]MBW9159269.1 class I SAM-dependent methyltransferase [Clostridium tagluense]WLC66762.1 class I SAM-dependent methyltransferase [Clostridium tagluense]